MEQIIVIKPNGTQIKLLSYTSHSSITEGKQKKVLLGENTVSLTVKSITPLNFGIGDYCTIYGEKYWLNALPTATKSGNEYNYELLFEGIQYQLIKVQYLSTGSDGMSISGDFSFMCSIHDAMDVLINNLARVYGNGVWVLGTCPDSEPKNLAFSGENCLAVLQRLCDEFENEFEISQNSGVNTIHIRQAGQIIPVTYEYGRGKGLYELTRQTVSSKEIITRLYAFGSDKNLKSNYRGYSQRLKLPLNRIPGEDRPYIEDSSGKSAFGTIEATKVFEEIFPHRDGSVTSLGGDIYTFLDSTMNFDLNGSDQYGTKYLIEGTSAKVHFTSGNLAGYEFELISYTHATKTFKIKVFKDERDAQFPSADNDTFRIGVNDTYVLLDVNMPQSYVTTAENELYSKAVEFLGENCRPRVQYALTFDEMYLKNEAGGGSIVNWFNVGDYVGILDADLNIDGSTRIQSFTRDIIRPYKYELELSEEKQTNIIQQTIAKVIDHNRVIQINKLGDIARARMAWKTTVELTTMLETLRGEMLLIGTEVGQYETNITSTLNYNGDVNSFHTTTGTIQHVVYTDFAAWNIAETTITNMDSGKAYYVYIKCSKSQNSADVIISDVKIEIEGINGYYCFNYGIISNQVSGARILTTTKGYTQITGDCIKTGKIESVDGYNYLDLRNNRFRVGDTVNCIEWNYNGDGLLRLKGAIVQNPGGSASKIGLHRGAYNNSSTYYNADIVTYNGLNYRYIYNTQSSGHIPTNSTYWEPFVEPGTIYRGEWQDHTAYYNNTKRQDIVKYSGIYYRYIGVDGNGSSVESFNSSDWQNLGANFDGVAAGTLFANEATIADWKIKDGKITSVLETDDETPRAQLDGTNGGMSFASDIEVYTETGGVESKQQEIIISSEDGIVEASIPDDNDVSRITSQGIFTNKAGISAVPSYADYEVKAAIVGLGFGNLRKTAYNEKNAVVGVFGTSNNGATTNPAPDYGGFFEKLFVAGLYLNVRFITSNCTISNKDVYLVFTNSSGVHVDLPTSPILGQTYILRSFSSEFAYIDGNGTDLCLGDGNNYDSININNTGNTIIMIFNGTTWSTNMIKD